MSLSQADLENRFAFSTLPFGSDAQKRRNKEHADLRETFINMAEIINILNPGSRETEIALTELESASHWAHKALSRAPLAEYRTRELSPEVAAQLSQETPEGTGPEGSDGAGAGSH